MLFFAKKTKREFCDWWWWLKRMIKWSAYNVSTQPHPNEPITYLKCLCAVCSTRRLFSFIHSFFLSISCVPQYFNYRDLSPTVAVARSFRVTFMPEIGNYLQLAFYFLCVNQRQDHFQRTKRTKKRESA